MKREALRSVLGSWYGGVGFRGNMRRTRDLLRSSLDIDRKRGTPWGRSAKNLVLLLVVTAWSFLQPQAQQCYTPITSWEVEFNLTGSGSGACLGGTCTATESASAADMSIPPTILSCSAGTVQWSAMSTNAIGQVSESAYEAAILTPGQAFAVLTHLPEPERTLTLLAAATGLRISECLGLQWQDVDFNASLIRVRRTWAWGRVGLPKSKASQAPVPMHPMLAKFDAGRMHETPYARPNDWVFPSLKLKGKQPRVANMLVSDYLRPAAIKAGVIRADWEADSAFTTSAIHSRRISYGRRLTRKPFKLCSGISM